MYYCPVCKRQHRTGKIYQDHLKYKQNKQGNPERELLHLKLAKVNRKIAFGNYNKESRNFLIGIRLHIERKLNEIGKD